jgi:hypothetical protein
MRRSITAHHASRNASASTSSDSTRYCARIETHSTANSTVCGGRRRAPRLALAKLVERKSPTSGYSWTPSGLRNREKVGRRECLQLLSMVTVAASALGRSRALKVRSSAQDRLSLHGRDCESTTAPVSCPSMLLPRRPRAAFSNLGEFTVPAMRSRTSSRRRAALRSSRTIAWASPRTRCERSIAPSWCQRHTQGGVGGEFREEDRK